MDKPIHLPPTFESFGFTQEQGDKIDAKLKAGTRPERPVLRSARPERRAASPDVIAQGQVGTGNAGQPGTHLDATASADPRAGKVSLPIIRPQLDFGSKVSGAVHAGNTQYLSANKAIPSQTFVEKSDEPPQSPRMVPNPHPPITPMSVADAVSIDLPSKFAYYPFKDLYIKPFRVPHLAKLSKAVDVDSMQLQCEVVSSVLSTPEGHTNIAFSLAVADFNAILYWLRAASFKKPTMNVTSICSSLEHHNLVNERKLLPATLETKSAHTISELRTNYLEEIPDPEYYHVVVHVANPDGEVKPYRIDLRPETMMDTIEFLDDQRFADPEFQYLVRIASYLDADKAFPRPDENGVHKRWTLQEKIGIVEEHMENEDVLKVLEFSELCDKFGVDEMVKVKCKECGFVELTKLTIDARTFLSPGQ